MMSLVRRGASACAVVLACALAVRADDVEKIEKATRLVDEAARWSSIFCYQKATDLLAQADQELQGVDETGKAGVVSRLKEQRGVIAEGQKSWDADRVKRRIEQQISTAESTGARSPEEFERETGIAQAMLDDAWNKAHLDAGVRAELEKKLAWAKKKVESEATRGLARSLEGRVGRMLSQAADSARRGGEEAGPAALDTRLAEIEELISEEKNAKALGPEKLAEVRQKAAALKAEFAKAFVDARLKSVEKWVQKIQDFLDGKEKTYTDNVEKWFKYANEGLEKCPQGDARTTALREKLAQQRKTFDVQLAQGARDDVVKPAVEGWASCKESYGKDSVGWEAETTPRTLQEFSHNSPRSLGCDKTERFLNEVVQRWLEGDGVKRALAQFPNDPEFKKVYDEAKATLEKAGGKVCDFANALLDEIEKLPQGRERDDIVGSFYNLKVTINHATKGCSKHEATIKRIDGLDKRFGQEKEKAAADKEGLTKKLFAATNEAWPSLVEPWKSQAKHLDAPAALKDIGSWTGTVVHFTGGAHGVSWNRSGWNFEDQYYFILEVDGVPVCGNLDPGLDAAIKAVEKQTGIAQDDTEECVGVIDGTCKVFERVKNPFGDNYLRGRQLDGVRMRIVAWKAGTVAASCGQGTNLKKLPEFKEVEVAGSGASGGGGTMHFLHRLVAWGMSALLALAGLLAVLHGGSKFVPQLQEQKAKLGDNLGYTGFGLAALGAVWFTAALAFWAIGLCAFGSLPSVALVFAGAVVGLDLLRSKGKLAEETAAKVQPLALLLGIGALASAGIHFLLWDWPLL